jgi:UDP-GlcNAc:undecaprenyl-phosphate/decaprenyl-phosphate GlcNAc-1-phosphate transferase
MNLAMTIPAVINDPGSLHIPMWIYAASGLLMSFVISYIAIPLVHYTAWVNGLFAGLNGRTSHTHPIPLFGGVAIFVAFILSIITLGASFFDARFVYALAGMMIMFIAGIKDDLTISKPKKKLMGQLLAIFYISVFADIRITNLHDFLNIGDIPYALSIPLTIFVMIVITNGFNLIDGIDGLASGIGILISVILGIWFYITGNVLYTIMCSALAGGSIAFFYFNVFSNKRKLFLGDGGSLIIGLILGMMVVRFIQLEPEASGVAVVGSTPAFAIGLFVIPLFDTLRVFTIRIAQGKSPFLADRQHIHHYLIDLGFNHFQSTAILLSVNLATVIFCYLFQDIGTFYMTCLLLGFSILFSQMLVIKVRKKMKKENVKRRTYILEEKQLT